MKDVRLSIGALLASLRRGRRSRQDAAHLRFDPVYYLRRYPDLAGFSSATEAAEHYRRHGAAEGRFPNAQAEEEAGYERYLTRSIEFDPVAYRTLNHDLDRAFADDRDLILHYVRHGRAEGRKAVFSQKERHSHMALWANVFSASQFSAYASIWETLPADRDEALALFETWGISRLAPIRFDYWFDPVFYRRHYRIPSSIDDVEMYRDWLTEGFVARRAPNETRLLLPYLGDRPLPPGFDWRGYASAAGLKDCRDAAAAVIHLFSHCKDIGRSRQFLDGDDTALDLIEAIARYKLRQGDSKQAIATLETLDPRCFQWPASLHRLHGDALLATGKPELAKSAYSQAIGGGDKSSETFLRAARSSMLAKDFDYAANMLRAHHKTAGQGPAFEKTVSDLIDQFFAHISAIAHSAFAEPTPDILRVNLGLRQGLDWIVHVSEELALAPAPLGANPDGHVVLLGNETLHQCTYYRIEQKERQFRVAGIELRRLTETETDQFLTELPGARAAIFYRVPATPAVIRAILTARQMGIPTYSEIDDLIFSAEDYPPPLSTYGGAISGATYRGLQFGVELFRFAIALCDRAIASTPALLSRMKPLVRENEGLLIRNGLDERNRGMIALGAKRARMPRKRVRIFYGSGTLAHHSDFVTLAAPALRRILDKYSEVDLVLVGHVPQTPLLADLPDRVLRYPIIADIGEYWSLLANCDINLAVLHSDAVTDCKSEIKWLEAAIPGVPTVASRTATYCDVISDGVDGLIADSAEQWYHHLSRLVDDAGLRHSIGQAAHTSALDRYDLERAAKLWRAEFRAPQTASPRKRLRVLLCHVFFHPQSTGGATRVVEDNVAAIAANCPDIELAIFCSDEGGEPGRLRTSCFGNVPVFRFGATSDPGTDLTPLDPAAAAALGEVLSRFQPDVVHFHCVQRLTASVVRTCLDRAIPYIITLHDAWWISPHQFLTDEDGFLRLPDADPLASAADDPASFESEVHRRTLLAGLLQGAARLLSVSEGFTQLHQTAGLAPITLANGLPDLPPPFLPDTHSGPLRLSHIGGRASHKGADLVEATLRYNHFPHLSLLMVDGRLASGETVETRWGESAVTLCGPVAQKDVIDLYRRTDVLLAPSRWPESYGLVAREAAHFGLWVVASSIGGMGEDLIEGENGFRIDTRGRAELDRLLARFNGDPDLYRQGTARPVRARSSVTDQALKLAEIYRRLAQRQD